MLTGIWNSVAGYVIIEIKGKGLERFLNLAVHSGIEIWRVRRTGVATVTARVSVEPLSGRRPRPPAGRRNAARLIAGGGSNSAAPIRRAKNAREHLCRKGWRNYKHYSLRWQGKGARGGRSACRSGAHYRRAAQR